MAARIFGLVRVVSRAAWPHVTSAFQTFSHCRAPCAFSRAFSLNATQTAPSLSGVDMSSTVAELREFALLHGISLRGLRLKSDIFAAIQMHFGVFVKVHAGAHSAGLKLQEDSVPALETVEEDGDRQLKVGCGDLLFAMFVSHDLARHSIASCLKSQPLSLHSSPSGAFSRRPNSTTSKRFQRHQLCLTGDDNLLLLH